MKILQIHNKYQLKGGEDVVYATEKELLEANGHTVIIYERHNKEIEEYSLIKKSALLWNTSWSKESYTEITDLIAKEKPDICHVHNYMPLISPAVFYACRNNNVPVIQTLHNYRMLCSNAYLFREGKVCEECLGKSLYHSVKYGCYRNSRIQTYALARMIETHKQRETWGKVIDGYICLTDFAKAKFIEGGLPEDKLFIKPNFLSETKLNNCEKNKYFFFIGRLDNTKGISTLINSFKEIENIQIKVAGDGPLKKLLKKTYTNIEYLGQQNRNKILEFLGSSIALIFPSVWYETFGLVAIEAFACGKPVITSNLGTMSELIEDGKTGLLFEPGNAKDLAEKIKWAYEHKAEMKQMGLNARKVYEDKYTPENNYKMLMDIYNTVIDRKKL